MQVFYIDKFEVDICDISVFSKIFWILIFDFDFFVGLLHFLAIYLVTMDFLHTYPSNWVSKDCIDIWHLKILKRMTAQHVQILIYTMAELFYGRS